MDDNKWESYWHVQETLESANQLKADIVDKYDEEVRIIKITEETINESLQSQG